MTNEERTQIHDAMVRLADGRRDAFVVVFDGLWPHILRFVTRALPGQPDAEDAAQQTLLKVFARITDFDTSRDGVSWAFGIAGYEVMTARRRAQRRKEVPADTLHDRLGEEPTPEDAVIARDLHDALAETLGALTDADRAVLIEAQHQYGVSPAAWRKRRQRALERLRAIWRRRYA